MDNLVLISWLMAYKGKNKFESTKFDEKVVGLIFYKFAQSHTSQKPWKHKKVRFLESSVVPRAIFVLASKLCQIFISWEGIWTWGIKKSTGAKSGQYRGWGRT